MENNYAILKARSILLTIFFIMFLLPETLKRNVHIYLYYFELLFYCVLMLRNIFISFLSLVNQVPIVLFIELFPGE